MTVNTTFGSKFSMGTTQAAANSTQFAADTYTEVLEVENFGDIGDEASTTQFAAVKDGRVRKLITTLDAGTLNIVCGRDPQDAGQIAMNNVVGNRLERNFCIELNDKPNASGTNTKIYFRGLVLSNRNNLGSGSDVTKRTYNIAVNTAPIVVEAAPGS